MTAAWRPPYLGTRRVAVRGRRFRLPVSLRRAGDAAVVVVGEPYGTARLYPGDTGEAAPAGGALPRAVLCVSPQGYVGLTNDLYDHLVQGGEPLRKLVLFGQGDHLGLAGEVTFVRLTEAASQVLRENEHLLRKLGL